LGGTTWWIGFSADREQKYMYVADGGDEQVKIFSIGPAAKSSPASVALAISSANLPMSMAARNRAKMAQLPGRADLTSSAGSRLRVTGRV
jgi:hypothetical protein